MCDNINAVDFIMTEARMFKFTLAEFYNDPHSFRSLAFNLQQLTEKTLKLYLDMSGLPVPKTHAISYLINLCREHSVPILLKDYIVDNATEMSGWATDGKYETEIFISLKRIKETAHNVFLFLQDNGLMPARMEGITEETLTELSKRCNKDVSKCSIPVQNVLYCLYIRKVPSEDVTPRSLEAYYKEYCITDKPAELARLKALYCTNDESLIVKYVYRDFM